MAFNIIIMFIIRRVVFFFFFFFFSSIPSEDNNKVIINEQPASLLNKKRISYTVCRICLNIVSYSRIGRHMKKKHNNAAPYQCEICRAEFNRKHIMDDHRRKHTNNKPHK